VNTKQKTYSTVGMVHTEGGWPKDVDKNEPSQTSRLVKRMERDEEFIATVARLGGQVDDVIKQNNAIDIYEEFFEGLETDYSNDLPEAKTLTKFRDPSSVPRSASYISSHSSGTRVAVAYSVLKFQQQPEDMPIESYIWDFANPSEPRDTLTPTSQLCCINYSPKNENWLGAGQYNGQLAFFDLSQQSTPVMSSPIENSHKDPIYDCAWLQSKTGVEIMSCSTDGEVYFWDVRALGQPLETLTVTEKGGDKVLGGTCLEYEPAAGATKLMIGTEQGMVISCNRKVKSTNPADRIVGTFGSGGTGHRGPIYSLERNPMYQKNFMTVGDWCAMVWSEDIKTPIMTTPYYETYLTGGAWSPTRPGVFFLTKLDGSLDVWDLYHKSHEATLSIAVSDSTLTSFTVNSQGAHPGKFVAVGDEKGSVHIMELSDSLVQPQNGKSEGQAIQQLFDREQKREKNLEARAKEAKQRAKKKAQEKAEEELGGMTEEDLLRLEKAFFDATRDESQAEKDATRAEEESGGKVTQSRVDKPGRQSSFLGPASVQPV